MNRRNLLRGITFLAFSFFFSNAQAQIGEHRNDFAVGIGGGYVMSDVGFVPEVPQGYHTGMMGGLSFRYVCEKYFSTICAVYGEINYAKTGWKEEIKNSSDMPVINPVTGVAESYTRNLNYLQVPIMAHLGWGREVKGFQFFVQAGPQFGVLLNENTDMNYDYAQRNVDERVGTTMREAVSDTMKVERKFDYGIAAGLGLEYSHPKLGHFLLEGRYYYGLGNIYGDSKRDYFSKSNFGNIVIRLTYMFDITKTKTNRK